MKYKITCPECNIGWEINNLPWINEINREIMTTVGREDNLGVDVKGTGKFKIVKFRSMRCPMCNYKWDIKVK